MRLENNGTDGLAPPHGRRREPADDTDGVRQRVRRRAQLGRSTEWSQPDAYPLGIEVDPDRERECLGGRDDPQCVSAVHPPRLSQSTQVATLVSQPTATRGAGAPSQVARRASIGAATARCCSRCLTSMCCFVAAPAAGPGGGGGAAARAAARVCFCGAPGRAAARGAGPAPPPPPPDFGLHALRPLEAWLADRNMGSSTTSASSRTRSASAWPAGSPRAVRVAPRLPGGSTSAIRCSEYCPPRPCRYGRARRPRRSSRPRHPSRARSHRPRGPLGADRALGGGGVGSNLPRAAWSSRIRGEERHMALQG